MKKGRHRRYEEARNLKRGPDLDIEAIFNDLSGEPGAVAAAVDDDTDTDIEVDPDELYADVVDAGSDNDVEDERR